MFYKLDWFAFTFPISPVGEGDNDYTLSSILMAFHDHTSHRLLGVVTNSLWRWEAISGFYDHKISCPKTGLSISWKSGNNYALCELSGHAVDAVLTQIEPRDLALSARERATRIDFAIDIDTPSTPQDFVAKSDQAAFATRSTIESPSGVTCYVGSRSGERMARVYRYAYPHPRSRLLRVEAEYKGDAAKTACAALLKTPLKMVCLAAHAPFAWQHPAWKPDIADVSKLKGKRQKTPPLSHLHWLLTVAVPSLAKAHKLEHLDAYVELKKAIDKLADII